MRQIFGLVVLFMVMASSAYAAEGQGFYSVGAVVDRSGGLIDVSVPVLPHLAIEAALPISEGPFSAGYELAGLFYWNRTERWGKEFGFGFLAGGVFSLNLTDRLALSTGGGLILSNPLSDQAAGGFLEGNEGNPAAQLVRDPVKRPYIRGAVRYRVNDSMAIQFGTRNTSPFVSIGWIF